MILVTATNRTTSRELIRCLVKQGSAVRALVYGEEDATPRFAAGVDVVHADPEDGRTFDAAMVGVGQLFLNAIGAREPAELRNRLLESAVRAGVAQVVYVTRAGDDGQRAKLAARMRELGIQVTELRITLTMQSLSCLAPELEDGELRAPLGAASVALVDARDVAEVAASCLSTRGSLKPSYDLTGPELLNMADVAAQLSERLGHTIRYVSIPLEAAERTWIQAGIDQDAASELALAFRLAAVASGVRPSGAVRELTGHEPRSLAQLLAEDSTLLAASTQGGDRRHQREREQRSHQHPKR
jgi:uncharacterized protein YbjT (DUF2867 family)